MSHVSDEIEYNTDYVDISQPELSIHNEQIITINGIDSIKQSSDTEHISTFIWKIPSLNKEELSILCNHYIRFETTQHIPYDIIHICIRYLDDSALISMMKNAKNGEGFKSNFFSIGDFKFFIDLYPDGYGEEAKGCVDTFLNLASLSPIIPKITAKYNVSIDEIKRDSDDKWYNASFSDNDISSCILRLSHDDIQHINIMKLRFNIKEIIVYNKVIDDNKDNKDNDDENISESHCIHIESDLGLHCDGFIWSVDTINNAMRNAQYFESDIFMVDCFKFILKIYKTKDDDYDLCVCLLSLSPHIARLCLYYRLCLSEESIESDGSIAFSSKSLHFWPNNFLTKDEMNKYSLFTIKMEIYIIDVFDADGQRMLHNDYTALHKYNNNTQTKHSKYEWIIRFDDDRLDAIKTASYGVHFNSDCFSMHGFKWFMQLFPGGYNAESDDSADLFLYLVSLPPHILCVAMKYRLILMENGANFNYSEQFCMDNFLTGWPSNALNQSDICDMNSLTFTVDIDVIDVFDVNGLSVDYKYNDDNCVVNIPTQKYLWNITDSDTLSLCKNSTIRRCFMSSFFICYGLKWYLQLFNLDKHPSKDDVDDDKCIQLYICLVSMPPPICRISFQYELMISELNIHHSHFEQFTPDDTSIGLSNIKKAKHRDIVHLDRISIEANINLIDVYDVKGNNITNRFIQNMDKVKEMDVPTQEFIWDIQDRNALQRLKAAKNGSIFRSRLFWIDNVKFMMQICPNGSNPKRCGSFNWYIYAASIPPNVAKIAFFYRLRLKGSNAYDCDCKELKVKSCSWGWGNDILQFDEISEMSSLQFILEMGIVDIYTFNGEYHGLDNRSPLTSIIMDKHIWIIDDDETLKDIANAKNKECFYGEMFGETNDFKWRLQFYPNGSTKKFKNEAVLCIKLVSFPVCVKGISIYFELNIVETGTRWTHCSHFRANHLEQGWETERIKFKHIKKLNKITLSATIHLIDVYDTNSNIITQKYIEIINNIDNGYNDNDDEYLV